MSQFQCRFLKVLDTYGTVLRIGYTELDEIEIEMIIAIRGFQDLRCFFTRYSISLSTLSFPSPMSHFSKCSSTIYSGLDASPKLSALAGEIHDDLLPLQQCRYRGTARWSDCRWLWHANANESPLPLPSAPWTRIRRTNMLTLMILLDRKIPLKGDGTIWMRKRFRDVHCQSVKIVLSQVFSWCV